MTAKKTYKEYYQEAQKVYTGSVSESKADLYKFDMVKLLPDRNFDKGYISAVRALQTYVDKAYQHEDNIFWPNGYDDQDFILRLKNPWIPEVNDVAKHVIPYVESHIYGCNAHVFGCYTYRSKYGLKQNYASWLWHYDNHPHEVLKIMVYLNKVSPNSAPFESIKNSFTNMYVKAETTRIDHTQWRAAKNNSRMTSEEMTKLNSDGCYSKTHVGPQGTTIIFDNNIIHRATNCYEEHRRDVVVFMVKPTTKVLRPYIDQQWTGTNYHHDVYSDPTRTKVTKK